MLGLIFILVLCVLITYHELRKQIVDWPALGISFDPERHIRFRGYAEYLLAVGVDGTKGVERARLRIIDIEPARNKRKLEPLVNAVNGSYLMGNWEREKATTEFSVDPGTPTLIRAVLTDKTSFHLNRLGATPGDGFPFGTYKLTVLAHGKDVRPCRRVFKITKSRKKKTPIEFTPVQ